jgi:hypothetical protein
MEKNSLTNSRLLRFGGIAGIIAGLCILTFFIVSESLGFMFTPEVLTGGSITPWMDRINENSQLARLLSVLPIVGFSSMLVIGLTLFLNINDHSWQKYLAIVGYLIGVPIVVATFVSHLSLVNQLITLSAQGSELNAQIQIFTAFKMHHFMIINFAIGPFFIIILGNSFIAWAALKSGLLPKWLCYWAFFNGSLILIGIFSVFFPALQFAQIGGPLTMLWFITTGVVLFKKGEKKEQ